MKLHSRGLLIICLAASIAAPALAGSGGFSSTGSMNVARVNHTATRLANGEALVAGGSNSAAILASAELYNPATGKWTLTGSMTIGRWNHQAVELPDGRVLVAGGFDTNDNVTASAELCNPSTGKWMATGNMGVAREDFTLTLLPNGEVLAAGGAGGLASAELYNPTTGTWTATSSMTSSNGTSDAILLQNGEVFVTMNLNLYNASTSTWTVITNAPSHRGTAPFALFPNGNVFLASGGIFGDDIYNPSTSQWTSIAPPPCTTRSQNCESAGALLNTGRVLVAGGVTYVNAQPYPIEETNGLAALFDPATLTWATTGSMNKSRLGETMTVLSNGQVLIAGGQTFDKHLGHLVEIASAELYTP
jgi:hypothetical protein